MPALFIFLPLLAVVILNLPNKETAKKMALGVGLAAACIQMLMSLTPSIGIWQLPEKIITMPFVGSLSINFFSLVVLFTIGLIALISLMVGNYGAEHEKLSFVNLILIIMMGMNGVVMVNDIFTLYVFLEVTAVCSFILIALYKGLHAFEGAFKYLVMSAVATLFMLSAAALLFMSAGGLEYKTIADYLAGLGGKYPVQVLAAFILLVTGLSIKAGVVPFHGWLPDAYSSAPSGVSVLLAGIVTKVAGVYTIMRLFTDVFKGVHVMGSVLMVLGAASIIVGALAAIGQNDFKRMLAYSSISQVGYIILSVSIGTPLGFAGALFHFFNHATFKSLLFVDATAVEMQTGTRDMSKLGGLASKMPITGGSSVIAFLSVAGIPPLSGFWSKLVIIIALWSAGLYAYAAIALLASVLTLGYFLLLQRKVFFGKLAEGLEGITESKGGIIGAAVILSAIILAIGLLFPLVFTFMQSKGLI